MKKNIFIISAVICYQLGGCTLVDYKSTKTESPPVAEAGEQNKTTLQSRIADLERRVQELEDKLKARW